MPGAWSWRLESLVRYIELSGQDGEHYLAALELYDAVELAKAEADARAAERAEAQRVAAERAEAERLRQRAPRLAGWRRREKIGNFLSRPTPWWKISSPWPASPHCAMNSVRVDKVPKWFGSLMDSSDLGKLSSRLVPLRCQIRDNRSRVRSVCGQDGLRDGRSTTSQQRMLNQCRRAVQSLLAVPRIFTDR